MRIIFCALLFVYSSQSISQHNSKSDFPNRNLYIILLDKTGSMLTGNYGGTEKAARSSLPVSKLKSAFFGNQKINFSRDQFAFFTFGMGTGRIITDLKSLNLTSYPFSQLLIHSDSSYHIQDPKAAPFISFTDYSKLHNTIIELLSDPFAYNHSFASLAKYMVIKRIITINNKDSLTLKSFRKIFITVITDDGEDTYQWLEDGKTINKLLPRKKTEILETIDKLETNEFSPLSKRWASFNNKYYDTSKGLKIFLYEFKTSFSSAGKSTISFKLKNNSIKFFTNSVTALSDTFYLKIDSAFINKERIKDTVFTGDFSLPIKERLNNSNTIKVYGSLYEYYYDSILGYKFRPIPFTINEKRWSPAMKSKFRNIVVLFIIICSLTAIYFIHIKPRQVLLIIQDNLQNKIHFTRRELKKAESSNILQLYKWERGPGVFIKGFKKSKDGFILPGNWKTEASPNRKSLWLRADSPRRFALHLNSIHSIQGETLYCDSSEASIIDNMTDGLFSFHNKTITPAFKRGNISHLFPQQKDLFDINQIVITLGKKRFNIHLSSIYHNNQYSYDNLRGILSGYFNNYLENCTFLPQGHKRTILKYTADKEIIWLAFEIETSALNTIKLYYSYSYSHPNNISDQVLFDNIKKNSGWSEIESFETASSSDFKNNELYPRFIFPPCRYFIYLGYPNRFSEYSEKDWQTLICIYNPFTDFGKVIKDLPSIAGRRRLFKGAFLNIGQLRNAEYLTPYEKNEPIELTETSTLQIQPPYLKIGNSEIEI